MKKIVVAVDGPAGSGKSSVSKHVAVDLGLKYIDSGAIYRAVTLFFLEKEGALAKGSDLSGVLEKINIDQDFQSDGTSKTYLNGRDVSDLIRDESINKSIGIVSDDRRVRDFVNSLLREWAGNGSIIMDGRDIGTVVFPGADLKIYLDASIEVRAERRILEYRESGKYLDENEVKNQIILRDGQDGKRPYGRLVRADDAIYIDTSDLNQAEVESMIKRLVEDKTA
ncbi:MAG: (d)CMP kinase [Spirochaetes bacterium]|nr:(d)CMP kinase [Spirochaetota bacterium]